MATIMGIIEENKKLEARSEKKTDAVL